MRTQNRLKARILDHVLQAAEAIAGRQRLNRLGGYVYWRTRGENLDDPDRNGEYHTLEVVATKIIGQAAVAFDVGANIGDWTSLYLGKVPQGRVFAFEPVRQTFDALQQRHRGDARVNCINAAVSDHPGQCVLRVARGLSGSNSIYSMPDETDITEESVQAVTGDAVAEEENLGVVDYLKIDVEGHEVCVLRGCSRLLAEQRLRFLQWEYNKTWIPARTSLRDVFQLLVPSGYKLCKIRGGDLLHYSSYSERLDNFCYSNWIAVRASDFERMSGEITIKTDTQTDW